MKPGDWVAVFLAVIAAGILLLACNDPVVKDPGILCFDGTRCPSWTSCPPPGYSTGHCDAVIDVGPGDPNGRYDRATDAGTFMDRWPERKTPPVFSR